MAAINSIPESNLVTSLCTGNMRSKFALSPTFHSRVIDLWTDNGQAIHQHLMLPALRRAEKCKCMPNKNVRQCNAVHPYVRQLVA